MNYEVFVLLMMVASGAILGVIYDIVRAVKSAMLCGTKARAVSDFLYWVFAALFIAYMLLVTNDGIIRAYEFCGIILGAILYFFTLSRWILGGTEFILENILDSNEMMEGNRTVNRIGTSCEDVMVGQRVQVVESVYSGMNLSESME